jgi:hypothetical protein
MASSGFQADVKALQKVLSARHLVSFNVNAYNIEIAHIFKMT